MNNLGLSALVVDDDVMVRILTMRALTRVGFQCDGASDGNEAIALADGTQYDAVVTDLKMPNMHGHALAVELLTREHHPLLFVLTAVTEPRMVKDLLFRGVADVLLKPIDYVHLATKVKSRVDANLALTRELDQVDSTLQKADIRKASEAPPQTVGSGHPPSAIDKEEYQKGLSRIDEVMPASEAALTVYRMTQSDAFDSQQLACAIAKHDLLATEVIQLANTPFYNPHGEKISQLHQASLRFGRKRIGQLALAANAQAAMLRIESSPQKTDSIWHRSVAAGIAMELLIARGYHNSISEGLLLCATTQELGRVLLASLYPKHYERAFRSCLDLNLSIFEVEQATLPQSQNEVMCTVLESWNVPSESFEPLKHLHESYESMSSLPEPLRIKTELVKIAGLVAKVAIGVWEPWDHVEIPTNEVLDRLGPLSIAAILKEVRENIVGIHDFGSPARGSDGHSISSQVVSSKVLPYYDATSARYNFLVDVLASMNVKLMPCKSPTESEVGLICNCIGVRSRGLLTLLGDAKEKSNTVVICDPQDADYYRGFNQTIVVPTSYAALKQALFVH